MIKVVVEVKFVIIGWDRKLISIFSWNIFNKNCIMFVKSVMEMVMLIIFVVFRFFFRLKILVVISMEIIVVGLMDNLWEVLKIV